MEEQQVIQNPEALLALVQQAVQHLIEQRPDTSESEAQLRAVAKAIEQLEKQRVPVPDSLRQTKMDLVAKIGQRDQFEQQLKMLGDGLAEIMEMIEQLTGKPRLEGKPQKKILPHQRRPKESELPTTAQKILGEYIVKALTEIGGSAHCLDVLNRMELLLKDELLPGDFGTRITTGQPVWHNNTQWARQKLVNKGILRRDSKRGYWELNKDYVSDTEET